MHLDIIYLHRIRSSRWVGLGIPEEQKPVSCVEHPTVIQTETEPGHQRRGEFGCTMASSAATGTGREIIGFIIGKAYAATHIWRETITSAHVKIKIGQNGDT